MSETETREQLKREVRASVIEWLQEYRKTGTVNGEIDAFNEAFPGAPDGLYWDAWIEIDNREEEAWWEGLERTIDGEIVRRALANDNS